MPPLQRVTAANGVVFFRSSALHTLGVPHAFTSRIGGVSDAPFDTLNLAGSVSAGGADLDGRRRANHRLVLEALDRPDHAWAALHLVHGTDVRTCHDDWPQAGVEPSPTGDAVVATVRGRMLKVTTADCVGVIMASSDGAAVAVIHAGWRGVVGGIVARTIAAMERLCGATPESLVAAIGPAISLEAFEVGEDVAAAFSAVGLASHVRRSDAWARPHVDLHAAIGSQLENAGVRRDRIDGEPLCTAGHPDLFFSHRRDAGRTGRMAAVAAVGATRS